MDKLPQDILTGYTFNPPANGQQIQSCGRNLNCANKETCAIKKKLTDVYSQQFSDHTFSKCTKTRTRCNATMVTWGHASEKKQKPLSCFPLILKQHLMDSLCCSGDLHCLRTHKWAAWQVESLCCVCSVFRVRATGLLTSGTPRSTPPPRWRTGDCPPRVGSSSSWTRPAGAGTPGCGPSSLCSWRSGSRSSRRWPAPGRGGCRWWRCTAAPELGAGSPPRRRNPPFWWRSRRRPSRARSGTSGTPRLEGPSPRTPHPKCSPVWGETKTKRRV